MAIQREPISDRASAGCSLRPFRLLRDADPDSIAWLSRRIEAGTLVYPYTGHTYGMTDDDHVAVVCCPDTADFVILPRCLLEPAGETAPVKAVIFDYDVVPFPDGGPAAVIVGYVSLGGDPVAIRTSTVIALDERSGLAHTRNSLYALEGPRNPAAARRALTTLHSF